MLGSQESHGGLLYKPVVEYYSTTTRSTNTFLLQLPPKHNIHSTNTRAWAISVPYSCNTLPTLIRTTPSTPNFKKLLKTYLFNMKH